ncbi:MAG TPA: hypothetical protein VMW46_09380 [Candidatus Desulfaltia sp.]|nr:hypothetical protein [Candidatus Desulfaltia sp.]
MRHTPNKRALLGFFLAAALAAFFGPASAQTMSDDQEQVQHQIERAKIFREAYPVIAEVDLYCSLFVHEGELPDLMITGAEKGYEKTIFSDADIVFLNKGKNAGLEVGQVFLVVEIGDSLGDFGHLANKRGRAHVIFLEDERAVARIEKSCGRVMVGNYLLPFEELETLLGKDIGYEIYAEGETGQVGNIIYLERDYNQIGSGGWAIIDIGDEAGIQVGQQLTIYKRIQNPQTLEFRKDLPKIGVGSSVVISVGKRTATVKVLSCWDSISMGQTVQGK